MDNIFIFIYVFTLGLFGIYMVYKSNKYISINRGVLPIGTDIPSLSSVT